MIRCIMGDLRGSIYTVFGLALVISGCTQSAQNSVNPEASSGSTVPGGDSGVTPPSTPYTPDNSLTSGWTEPSASSDTIKIYLSSSQGNDLNNGLSPETAVRSFVRARNLVRDGFPDWILLKAGDTFTDPLNMNKSGRSDSERMLISSYGTGERPLIVTSGTNSGFSNAHANLHNLNIIGLHFRAGSPGIGSGGIFLLGDVNIRISNILVEDCYVDQFQVNVVIQNINQVAPKILNIALRRNIIVDAFSGGSGHSQGAYISDVDGMLIEENLFDHNGWKNADRSDATIFNHNLYMQTYNTPHSTVRQNIFARGSSHGIQLRSGGEISDNLFVQNPIALLIAGGDGADQAHPAGVRGLVDRNIILQGNDINSSSPRAWGINVSDIGVDGVTVSRNIVAHDETSNASASITPLTLSCAGATGMGCNNITVDQNIFYDWRGTSRIGAPSSSPPAGSLYAGVVGNTFTNNDFHVSAAAAPAPTLMSVAFAADSSQVSFRGNTYWSNVASSRLNSFNNTFKSYAQWISTTGEIGSSNRQIIYVDPTRKVADYNSAMGGAATLEDFLSRARQQRKGAWDENYSAESVNTYIRDGFAPVDP